MAGDTVKWPILRDSATGTDILITKSPSSSMGEKHKKALLAGTLWQQPENQNNMPLCISSQRKQRRIWCSFEPLGSNRFCEAKGNGKVLRKKKKNGPCHFFVWHLPRKSPKSEIINELSPVNTNIPLTVSNSQTWIPILVHPQGG